MGDSGKLLVPDAVQRATLLRRAGTQCKGYRVAGPRLCSAPLRAALRPGHETCLLRRLPRRQHAGDLKASHDLETTSYPLWTLDEATVTRLVKEGGIVAPTGKAGGMLMFHGNLVHGSAGNITPYPRKIVYLTLNAVSNYIRTPTRPEYIAHRDFTPIQTVDDDALLRLARAHREAAE